MKLTTAALVAAIGMCCTFVLRTAGTLYPELFTNLAWAKFAATVRILAQLALTGFFVVFLKDYVRSKQGVLRIVTWTAMVAMAIALLPPFKLLLHLSGVYPVESLIWSRHLEALAPLIGSIAMLAFFIVLRRDLTTASAQNQVDSVAATDPDGSGYAGTDHRLLRPTTFAAMGSGVFVLLNAITAVGYFESGQLRWLAEETRPVALGVQLVVTAAFVALVSFYFALYGGAPHRRG